MLIKNDKKLEQNCYFIMLVIRVLKFYAFIHLCALIVHYFIFIAVFYLLIFIHFIIVTLSLLLTKCFPNFFKKKHCLNFFKPAPRTVAPERRNGARLAAAWSHATPHITRHKQSMPRLGTASPMTVTSSMQTALSATRAHPRVRRLLSTPSTIQSPVFL